MLKASCAGSLTGIVRSLNMSVEGKPKWKRALLFALKVYVCFCTVIVTAYLALLIWFCSWQRSTEIQESTLLSVYGRYMAKEYPARAEDFAGLAQVLGLRS